MGAVAVAPGPGTQGTQLYEPRLFGTVIQMGNIDSEGVARGQQNTPFKQTPLLQTGELRCTSRLFGCQMVSSAGNDGPAAEKCIAERIGGQLVLSRPTQAGAKDKMETQPRRQRFQRGPIRAVHDAWVVDFIEADDIGIDRLNHPANCF